MYSASETVDSSPPRVTPKNRAFKSSFRLSNNCDDCFLEKPT